MTASNYDYIALFLVLLPHFWMGECCRNKRLPRPSVYNLRTIVLTKFDPVGWPKRWESRWLAVDENNKPFQPETFGLSMHVEAYRRPSLIFRNQPCSRKNMPNFYYSFNSKFYTIKHIGLLLRGCLDFLCVFIVLHLVCILSPSHFVCFLCCVIFAFCYRFVSN